MTALKSGHVLGTVLRCFFCAVAVGTYSGVLSPNMTKAGRQQRRVACANSWYGNALMSGPVTLSATVC